MANLAEALRLGVDRREYPRVPVTLSGRVSISTEDKSRDVQVIDLSAGGAGLRYRGGAPRAELIGDLAVEGFGRFEGITTRESDGICGLRFLVGEAERQHLLECLSAFVSSGLPSVASLRQSGHWPIDPQLFLTRHTGEQIRCKVIDISLQGAVLGASALVPKDEYVLVGKMFGRVIGNLIDEITVQFLKYQGAIPAMQGGA
jgi:hypothetical protein